MSASRRHLALLQLLLICAAAHAQETPAKPAGTRWFWSASSDLYLVPDGRDYAQPTVALDRGWLHVEVRYNSEHLETGSLWVGYNLNAGEKLALALTPMVSAVIGETDGVAPGYELTLNWRKLELYSEGEWVFNVRDRTDSFFFAWSELTLAPFDWLELGIVGQRTQAFDGERDIQRGALLRTMNKHLAITAHVFNPDTENPLYVFSIGVEF